VRRYIRIGGPLCGALLISPYLGIGAEFLLKGVLWSLYCELVYYTVYPAVRRAARRFGWELLTIAAFAAAFCLAIVHPERYGNYSSGNVFWDSLLGLPCWLMGCVLAERPRRSVPTTKKLWLMRSGVFLASVGVLELRFHSPLHSDLTLNFFAVLTLYWLSLELSYYGTGKHAPWALLERAGTWSYSLYVFHLAANNLPVVLFPSMSDLGRALVRMPLTLAACYLFYLLIERPSHRLARLAARAFAPAASGSNRIVVRIENKGPQ
jgi:peptidoglycan/LPS O-acetylase OafA/YrhL